MSEARDEFCRAINVGDVKVAKATLVGVVSAQESMHTDTDPNTNQPIPDKNNVVYDDADLDGDGMVGRIEKALAKDPVTADSPLALTQIVTGEEPESLPDGGVALGSDREG